MTGDKDTLFMRIIQLGRHYGSSSVSGHVVSIDRATPRFQGADAARHPKVLARCRTNEKVF